MANPSALTNGAPTSASAGATEANVRTDVKALLRLFLADNPDAESVYLLMSPANAVAISVALNIDTLGHDGGVLYGARVVTSTAAGDRIIALDPSQTLLAEDPAGVTFDTSRHATLQLDTAPDNPTLSSSVEFPGFSGHTLAPGFLRRSDAEVQAADSEQSAFGL